MITALRLICCGMIISAVTAAICWDVVSMANVFCTSDVRNVKPAAACIILGTSRVQGNGAINEFYVKRILAGAELYKSGKVQVIIVSGDNRTVLYNEPDAMKSDLMGVGVPANRIICDYAGRNTIDSIDRFKNIFGQYNGVVISQEFHNARAIYIGISIGVELQGFNAEPVSLRTGLRTYLREVASRVVACMRIGTGMNRAKIRGDRIDIESAQQVDSAEASTNAVPPSIPSGSPR